MLKYSILIVLVVVLISACKKGQEDPFISFRSRINRLAGEWKMTYGKEEGRNINGSFTRLYNKDTVYTGSSILSRRKCTWEFTFKKDGSYLSDRKEYWDSLFQLYRNETGKWNFIGKVGDWKNKEQIFITINHTSMTGISYGTEIQNEGMVWQLIQLSNQKIHLYTEEVDGEYYEKRDYILEPR